MTLVLAGVVKNTKNATGRRKNFVHKKVLWNSKNL
jgi:hypothetical protein